MIGRWFVLTCARVLGVERGLGCGENTSTGCGGFHGASFYSSMSASYTVFVAFCYGNIGFISMAGCSVLFLEIVAGNISEMAAAVRTLIQMKAYLYIITGLVRSCCS